MDVTCRNLTITRGSFTLHADWHLPSGSTLALIGPSGAGKSLFLGALCGFEETTGTIEMGGQEMGGVSPDQRPLTVMFQSHNLFPHLSVFDNVALGMHPGLRLSAHDRGKVDEALASVDLAGFAPRYPDALSGGQASRVALARALVRNRPILLLDEPFAALGPRLRRDMLSLVEDLQQRLGLTVIFVTHDASEATRAPLTSFVAQGIVSPPTDTRELFANPPKELANYL